MRAKRGLTRNIIIALVIAFALGLVFLYLTPHGKFLRLIRVAVKKDQQRKVHILSETDHQALLEACRDLSRRVLEGDLEPNRYLVRHKPHPEASRFPQLILDLDPMFIETASDGRVGIGMLGGIHHYGVTAYPINFEKPSDSFEYGDKKIIAGLWYYEDGYNPGYNKWIEKLIQKGKMRNQAKNQTDD